MPQHREREPSHTTQFAVFLAPRYPPAVPFTRNTKQRDAVKTAFQAEDRPLSPEEVLDLAQSEVPGLGIATVYRSINSLLDDGWLTVVPLVGEADRYEVAGKHHHHHFRCMKCRKVFEIEGCISGVDKLVPKGFKVTNHHIIFDGSCKSCR